MGKGGRAWIAAGGMATALLGAGGAPAGAVCPGENGRVAYVSGRGEASDASAKIYIQTVPGTDGTVLDTAAGQYRHPSWSPDQKHIAYGLKDGSGNIKVWVKDLVG